MGFSLATTLQQVQDTISTEIRPTPSGLTVGETLFDPASWHGHQGNGDVFVLTKDNEDFQLFNSNHDVVFIQGNNDTASFFGDDTQAIYNSGANTTVRFSDLPPLAKINVYGLNATSHVDFYNAASTAIQSDGQGGTLIGTVDFYDVKLAASQVSFLHSDTPLNTGGMVPLTS
jgi:hypothetical protein